MVLSDKPAWFEFLLTPNLLETHLSHPDPDPSPISLIIQFIFNGIKKNETLNCDIQPNSDIVEPQTVEVNKAKLQAMTVLPLQVAAHLGWQLDVYEQSLPLYIQDALLIGLLHESLDDLYNPTTHCILDTAPLLPYQLFATSLYHRYALRALVQNKLPTKPIKVSNVIIPGQQDPTEESAEVRESIFVGLEKGAENSVRILEQLLCAGEVRAPTLSTFCMTPSVNTSGNVHLWERCCIVPDEQFKCQIHYDLGVHHFLLENYGDAFHHFGEATSLFTEIGSSSQYCNIDPKRLKSYHDSCASICGRNTPLQKQSIYDQFNHAIRNNYENLVEILSEDNLTAQIPAYLRQNLQLDVVAFPEKFPQTLLYQIRTLNAVRCMFDGSVWDSNYVLALLQEGKQGAQYLVQMLATQMPQYTPIQKDRIRSFLITLNVNEGVSEVLVPPLMACAPLASLFTHEEIVAMWPNNEDNTSKLTKMAFDVSYGADCNDIGDLAWDIIHSYDPVLLRSVVPRYLAAKPFRPDKPKKEIKDLNIKWELPIPVHNTLMKLPQSAQQCLLFLYVAKANEAAMSKSFKCALELLSEACEVLSSINSRETVRLFKMITWLMLVTKIQQQLNLLPCVEETVMTVLTAEAKDCLLALNGREVVAPWTNVVNWCLLLLINVQDWLTILNSFPMTSQHLPFLVIVKPLAATAQALQDKSSNKKVWFEFWEIVVPMVVGCGSGHKRGMSGQSNDRHDTGLMTRAGFLEFISNIKESTSLSILISLLGRFLNILIEEPNYEIHIDHLAMWPSSVNVRPRSDDNEEVKETLSWLVDHATKLYPEATHTSARVCTSWHLTKADLAYLKEEYHSSMQSYLTAIFVATDCLRNEPPNDSCISNDVITRRMIKCCTKLNCFTQAAILCQFLENIDYSTALGCLKESNSVDAMDAYYDCLWDVTLMEFIINMHHKRGEIQRRDKVLKIIGLMEVNSNNNEEIQREAAKVRKHRFLRALAKQYL